LFADPHASIISLPALPPEPEPLTDWYESQEVQQILGSFVEDHLNRSWQDRVEGLQDMQSTARDVLWWPSTQHGLVESDCKFTIVDSAHGHDLQTFVDGKSNELVCVIKTGTFLLHLTDQQ
jgi:dethiobiotin synthetase/adenosylmethionine--8-amino-7-oxononanoate aminotransferase